MPSVLAIVSKSQFEQQTRGRSPAPGVVLGIDRYTSTNPRLEPLRAGGSLFLVTVRPPKEALWLVAILDAPKPSGGVWRAAPSTIAIADLAQVKGQLTFESGTGIQAKPGALGMSLQTPRVLTAADEALLRAAAGGANPSAAKPVAKPPTVARDPGGLLALERWRKLSPERQAAVVRHVVARSNGALAYVRTHAFGSVGVPALLHVATGVVLHLVPGGRVADGGVVLPLLLAARALDATELAALATPAAKRTAKLDRAGYLAHLAGARTSATVAADAVAKLESDLGAAGLRLPTALECAWAASAKGAAGANAFGLVDLRAGDELCAGASGTAGAWAVRPAMSVGG